MFERFRGAGTVLAGSLALLLAACGGGGGGGGSGGGGGGAKSCSEQFNPETAGATPAECQPVYNTQCDALDPRLPINSSSPTACTKGGADGGVVSEKASVDGVNYFIVRPTDGGQGGIYVALHWRTGNGATMVNNMRLAELAKARNLTVLAPDSPFGVLGPLLRDWDNAGATAKITAVIADAKARLSLGNVPVTIAGVSSGAAAAARYFCDGGATDGLLLVASGKISEAGSTACLSALVGSAAKAATSKAASNAAVVLVQGSGDSAYEDTVVNYGQFKTINGCGADQTVTLNPQVDIAFTAHCSGSGVALVTVKDSGHNWPGMDRPLPETPLDSLPGGSLTMNIYGPISYSFDATLQGYDLVRYLD